MPTDLFSRIGSAETLDGNMSEWVSSAHLVFGETAMLAVQQSCLVFKALQRYDFRQPSSNKLGMIRASSSI